MAPAASPARSIYKLQAAVLSEVRTFSSASLRHVPSIRVTDASGAVHEEPWRELQVSAVRQRWWLAVPTNHAGEPRNAVLGVGLGCPPG